VSPRYSVGEESFRFRLDLTAALLGYHRAHASRQSLVETMQRTDFSYQIFSWSPSESSVCQTLAIERRTTVQDYGTVAVCSGLATPPFDMYKS
jgi:hypothetical protein